MRDERGETRDMRQETWVCISFLSSLISRLMSPTNIKENRGTTKAIPRNCHDALLHYR